jgi:hypothetical protein
VFGAAKHWRLKLRPTPAFVTEMTEAWRGEFKKGVKKFKDGNYESALASFTAVSVHTSSVVRMTCG